MSINRWEYLRQLDKARWSDRYLWFLRWFEYLFQSGKKAASGHNYEEVNFENFPGQGAGGLFWFFAGFEEDYWSGQKAEGGKSFSHLSQGRAHYKLLRNTWIDTRGGKKQQQVPDLHRLPWKLHEQNIIILCYGSLRKPRRQSDSFGEEAQPWRFKDLHFLILHPPWYFLCTLAHR